MTEGHGGPLAGLRVVEFAGIGPGPFACMLLSDLGADVVTVQRPGRQAVDSVLGRGRTIVEANLKDVASRDAVLALVDRADTIVEGFRPGVMERLGLGPAVLTARNPRLVYGRMTGWGQEGPLATTAGHDIDYIAITGALHAIGTADSGPVPPLNLVGDFGGGSLYLVMGLLVALLERERSGRGQVVDAAIVDGTLSLLSSTIAQRLAGRFEDRRASNRLDGGTPYYGVYATADDRHVAVGPLEKAFFDELCERLGLDDTWRDAHGDRSRWPALRAELARTFATRSQAAWTALLEGTDACYAPVLPLGEAEGHPHLIARAAFIDVAGTRQPAPAPRLSRTPGAVQGPAPSVATPIDVVAARWVAIDRR